MEAGIRAVGQDDEQVSQSGDQVDYQKQLKMRASVLDHLSVPEGILMFGF